MNEITNGLLFQWHTEISNLQNSVIMLFLKDKLIEFYKEYGIKLDDLISKKLDLQKEYFEFEGEQIKHIEVTDIDGEVQKQPVMLQGKNYNDFMYEYKKLMDEKIIKSRILTNA